VKTIMAEFAGKRSGYFRPKPVYKVGRAECPRCGNAGHIGRTTCDVKPLPRPSITDAANSDSSGSR
jgi:hypothetical protein